MKKSDDLFQLIRSLSRNERRYFRLFSQLQKGDKTYIDLFNAMDKLKEYDERAFKMKNREKPFVKNLAWRKHHLYNLILKALESYHESIDTEVYSLLHKNEILYEKGLFRQCKKILARAKALAQKYELYHITFEILNWEDMISSKLFNIEMQKQAVDESKYNMKLLSNLTDYKDLLQRIYSLHHNIGVIRKKEEKKELHAITHSPLWKDEQAPLTTKAKRHYHYSHFLLAYMHGDMKEAYVHSKKCVDLLLNHPDLSVHNSHFYITGMNAYLYCCTALRKHDEMIKYIVHLNETKKKLTKQVDKAAAMLLAYHELGYYMMTGNMTKGIEAARRIEQEIIEFDAHLSFYEKCSLYVNLAFLYFMAGRYKECIGHLYKIISAGNLKARADMESMVRIFHIIAQYEKGSSPAFMKSLLRSTYRMLVKREQLYKFERIILDFIRKRLIRMDSRDDLVPLFKELRTQLQEVAGDPLEGRPLEYFDLVAWLTSKIEGRPFSEVVREKEWGK